jgi:hypothetical protein
MEPKVSISIDVSDMEKASLFYSEALGCKNIYLGLEHDAHGCAGVAASRTNRNDLSARFRFFLAMLGAMYVDVQVPREAGCR